MQEPESTFKELQVCTDASLVRASTTESFNVTRTTTGSLSSLDIVEGIDKPEAKACDGAEIGKQSNRIPVVALDGTALMPCTATKAKRLISEGKARYGWNKHGIFFITLSYVPQNISNQTLVLGIDPGSKWEGYSVSGSQDNLANLMVETKTWVKKAVETRRNMRRARRFRNTRRRQNKRNRKLGNHIAPSTRARAEARVEIARQLGKLIPFKTVVVEDVKAATKKGKKNRKWNASFSPLEVGKNHMYSKLKALGYKVKLVSGFQTKEIRDKIKAKKTTDKSKPVFEAHCLDAWVISSTVSNAVYPTNKQISYLVPLHFPRRQLHRLQFEKGGLRTRYGGTMSNGIKKGTLVNDSKFGLCYVGGSNGENVSLHSCTTGKRLTQNGTVDRKLRVIGYRNVPQFLPCLKAGVSLRGIL